MNALLPRRAAGLLLLVALAGGACTGDDVAAVELGTVERGEVVETVAAPARVEPRDRVTVSAPASGTVAELLVADGDDVEAGDELLRLTSPSVEQTVAQAEAAVEAAGSLAGLSTSLDLSPVLGTVRAQLQASVPELLGQLTAQAETLPEEARGPAVEAIAALTRSYDGTVTALQEAEAEAAAAAHRASASQRAAAEAQQAQAELALQAARDRADDLVVTAPASGVVELVRGGGGGGAATSLEDLGAAGGSGGGLPDVQGLLGGGATATSSGPIAVGSEVGAGQALLTVFDLSEFRAVADVDEIDVVEIAEGQRAVVLVDAFPDAELDGVVEHVALEPEGGAVGGVVFPVTVDLLAVPTTVRLRVGLSGSVEIVTRVVEDALVVPSSALRRRGEQDVVYIVRDEVVREVDVVVDAIGDDAAAVVGELEPGEPVVVSGLEEVEDGDPVPT